MSVTAAAMREAFGDGEHSVVKSILAQITAGAEHRAKEVACETVANLLMANKLLYALSPDDAIWQTLARNVFPDAPKPGPFNPKQPWSMPAPANAMDYFYTMGARHRSARLARERLDYLDEKRLEYSEAGMNALQELRRYRAKQPQHSIELPRKLRKLRRTADRFHWIANEIDAIVEFMEDHEVHHAEARLKTWDAAPFLPPRPRRQNAMRDLRDEDLVPPFGWPQYPESSDDEAEATRSR